MLIVWVRSAAYFRTCAESGWYIVRTADAEEQECDIMVGYIITKDGEESEGAITVPEALDIAARMMDSGKIDEDEMPELIRQIHESGLPMSMIEVEPAIAINPLNIMEDHEGEEDAQFPEEGFEEDDSLEWQPSVPSAPKRTLH